MVVQRPIKHGDDSNPNTPKLPKGPLSRPTEEFYRDKSAEPHAFRRKLILKDHPEIKTLMGPCSRTKWVVLGTVVFQTAMCYLMTQLSWFWVVFLTYTVSGTLNHMMMMGIHEISHNLAFKSPFLNRWLSIAASLPLGLPVAISFRRYHLEHHKYQGEDEIDVDVPTKVEAVLFRSWYGKMLWMFLQPFFYAVRPLIIKPKTPGPWEAANLLSILAWDTMLYTAFGPVALFYSIGGALLGAGLHPVAGHFLAEHLVLDPGSETYSYYGPLNLVTFNVGYHNEHHDFANIPGSRLPQVRAMAPEYYDSIPQVTSWTGVIKSFIFDQDVFLYDRVKRGTLSPEQQKEVFARDHQQNARWQLW